MMAKTEVWKFFIGLSGAAAGAAIVGNLATPAAVEAPQPLTPTAEIPVIPITVPLEDGRNERDH